MRGALPYLPLRKKERDRINALLRSCTKTALRLPPSTSNERLLKLGVHNTFEELSEATFTAQRSRLSNSVAGRTLLSKLNLTTITRSPEGVPLSSNLRSHLNVPPIPRNMHPERDEKRRKARARALQKQYGEDHGVVYVDAAAYTSGSREIEPPLQAEERLLSFRDILAYYRDERRVYAPPASSLTVTQAAHWRRLQTRTAPYPILLNAQYPDQFPSSCKLCGKPGDFLHILLTCPTFPQPPSPAVAVSYWESTMNSTSAFDQRKVISCAMKRIALQGLSCVL
ncbi:hypothetical protein HPB50_004022 [Hyalomma asiaticum]|uniref:Uncharacterized protein n=1 Tax=Hyalomma asiaticum TaxID=266040 RepID=A0ACB7SUY4_HYAAI|nr:hypothetical protein HPB50_004022 [Hyalomma asiaticum]